MALEFTPAGFNAFQDNITDVSTVLIGTASSTGTASQRLQVDGGAYVQDNLGIGTASPSVTLQVQGNANITGVTTIGDINTSGTVLNPTVNTTSVSIGYGYANILNNSSVAIGAYALQNGGSGSNTAIGAYSMLSNIQGTGNCAVGDNSLYSNFASNYNSAFGKKSGYFITGDYNSAFGAYTLYNITGNHNLALGDNAGNNQTSGDYNVIIGPGITSAPIPTGSNQLVIGAGNTAWIYGTSDYNIGIGITNPTSTLTVAGSGTSTSQLYVTGIATVLSSNLKIRNPANTFEYSIVGSAIGANYNLTLPNISSNDTLAALGNTQTFTGAKTFATLTATGTITLSGTAAGVSHVFGSNQTTSTLTFGGTSGTGLITFGRSTATQQTDIQAGASGVGTTKTINLGTGGLSGSFTNINIGPSAGVGTVVVNSGTTFVIGTTVSTGTASQPLQVTGGAYVQDNLGIGTANPSQKLEVVGGEIKAGRVDTGSEGGQLSFGRSTDNNTAWYIDVYGSTSTPSLRFVDVSNAAVRVAIDSSGNFGIRNASPTAALHLPAGSATANTSPIKFTSGTNLATAEAGTIEYDGTTLYSTPNTSFGRATIPTTLYTTGAGTAGITSLTNYAIFPAANDTITLPVGTYLVDMGVRVAVSGSTVSSALNLNIRGGGSAVGTFRWNGTSAILDAGSSNSFVVASTALGTVMTVTAASAANPRQYIFAGKGILKVTTQGTIIPAYQFPVTLTGGTTTLVADNYMILQSLDTQSAAAFGPAGAGWG